MGMVRQWQEFFYEGRYAMSYMDALPDFAKLATSFGHEGITNWNTHAGTFRDFLYNNNFVDKTRWLSDTKRVSKYCIEGERGFIHNNNASEHHYKNAIKKYI